MSKIAVADRFVNRHIGINETELQDMLKAVKADSLDQLIDETVPDSIRLKKPLNLPEALSEFEYLRELKQTAAMNKVFRTYIGMGYHGTITPSAILRWFVNSPSTMIPV